MTPFHLTNKTILVTGASSGIGRQVAISICNMGGNVIITGRDEQKLNETFNALPSGENKKLVADLLDTDDLSKLVNELPMLDGVVNCAGIVKSIPVKFLTKEKINETFSVNYEIQVMLMAQITRQKKLNNNSSIVFISSISGNHPHIGGALYAGSKAALEAYSKVIALEYFKQGIRSNCVIPAMVKTPMYDYAEKNASKETMDEHVNKYPLGIGMPEDVANACIFLLSSASRWMTGSSILLDGGFLLGGL
jgi:NAD(P)-dependent dehydrogenase (short-subunit alcohol dehydrogenase family)